jgi:hypothetical protein
MEAQQTSGDPIGVRLTSGAIEQIWPLGVNEPVSDFPQPRILE